MIHLLLNLEQVDNWKFVVSYSANVGLLIGISVDHDSVLTPIIHWLEMIHLIQMKFENTTNLALLALENNQGSVRMGGRHRPLHIYSY